MSLEKMLTYEEVASMLAYDPTTGTITRLYSAGGMPAGGVCGTVAFNGYITLSIKASMYYAHRVAWLLMTKQWPSSSAIMDHIDRDRSNNKWNNLRVVTYSQNACNAK